jgi:hypothetical protein
MKLIILITTILFAQNIYSAKVPHSWRSCHHTSVNTKALDKSGSNLGSTLESIFTDMSEFGDDITPITDKASTQRKFKLTEITTMLGVSAEGSIGVLGIGGAAVAEIHWGRVDRNDKSNSPRVNRRKRKRPHLKMNGALSLPNLDKKIHTLTEYLHKSGKVKNKKLLKKNLLKSALSFKEMASSITANQHRKWGLAAVQANFGVEAGGTVGIVSIGAAVGITFEWTFAEEVPPSLSGNAAPIDGKQKILSKVINVIQEDLNKTLSDYENHPHLKTSAFEIGLAVGASGDVGVASVGASVGMTLVFERNEDFTEEMNKMINDKSLSSVKFLPMARKLQKNDKARRNRSVKFKIVKLARKKFRKGLKKALKIGEYLSKKALKASKKRRKKEKKWKFSGLTAVFEIGLKGGIGVATLSGGSAIEIDFENPNF